MSSNWGAAVAVSATASSSSEYGRSEYCNRRREPMKGGRSQSYHRSASSSINELCPNKENTGTRRSRASTTTRKGKTGTPKTEKRDSRSAGHMVEDDPHSHRPVSARRSVSRDRYAANDKICQQEMEPTKRRAGSLPKRTKSNDKKSTRGWRESAATSNLAKKKAPIRRTRSYESVPTASKAKRRNRKLSSEECYRSFSNVDLLVPLDGRGLPLTSLGCAPVASLRATSPNCVDTENFGAFYAYKLQQEECARVRRRPRLDKGTSSSCRSFGSSRSLGDRKTSFADDERKPAAKRRSKSSKRSSRKENMVQHLIVPLNPEESIHYRKRNFAVEATTFVHKLKVLLDDGFGVGPTRGEHTKQRRSPFSAVLTDDELKDLVVSMFQTQSNFCEQGKPQKLDMGYHFCRGSNVKRFQQQPGLWSKIQARGVNRSQDGDGIYTFNNPQPSSNVACSDQDVWMAVARLQGSILQVPKAVVNSTRRQWGFEIDALVQPENDVVVLKASAQFFPLVQFRSNLLQRCEVNSARLGEQHDAVIRQMKLMQERLQLLLDDSFNADRQHNAESPPSRGGIGQRQQLPDPRTTERPLYFIGREAAVTFSAWEVAREIQATVEEQTGAAIAMLRGFGGKPPFSVQAAVSAEEMAVLADTMFRTQTKFNDLNKPSYIEIGYHYCRGQSLKKMQVPGFWANIQSRGFSKSEDGDGIYTFNDPLGTRSRGNRVGFFDMRHSISKDDDVWLLVARLIGSSASSGADPVNTGRKWDENVDALLVSGRQSQDVVVLKTSAQFFPVLQFPAACLDAMPGVDQDETLQELQMVHQRLQTIFDRFFNNGVVNTVRAHGVRLRPVDDEVLEYVAPHTLDVVRSIHSSSQQIYKVLSTNKKAVKDDCSICLDSLRWTSHQQVVRLKNCGHEFHRSCLHEALQHFDLCPICNQEVTPPSPRCCLQGLSPSGTMVTSTASHIFCQGCWSPGGSLLVSFFFAAGVQKVYHESPGVGYMSANWKAVLPYNEQGLRLLRRLQYAFLHGLLFTVSSAGQGGSAVRASIPLKTRSSTRGMNHDIDAFPDRAYFDRCNQELDRYGVPDFEGCQEFLLGELELANSTDQPTVPSPARQPQCMLSPEESGECTRVLRGLQQHQHGWMFCKALPALAGRVEKPMDFALIEHKLAHHEYASMKDYVQDVNLTFDNAMACHSKENPVHFMAKQLKRKFKKDLRQLG